MRRLPFPPPRTSCIGLSRSKSFDPDVGNSFSESDDVLCAMLASGLMLCSSLICFEYIYSMYSYKSRGDSYSKLNTKGKNDFGV